MVLTAAAALVIVETTVAAYGTGLATDAAIGLAVTLIDKFALQGFEKVKAEWAKRHPPEASDAS